VDDRTIEEQFAEFHRQNPHIYEALVRLARQAKASGRRKIGIELLFAGLRWERFITTTGNDAYKLNNNYRSRYARRIMEREPDLVGFFEIRGLRAA
jgi:hypothetical protein